VTVGTNEFALFLLRLASGLLLIAMLAALIIVMWRDYRSATTQLEAARRTYGRLVLLQEIDGVYTPSMTTYPLLPLTSIGRSPTNTILIDDTFASGEHALLALRSGMWWLEDRQSRNGTTLNNIPVTETVIVTDGDIIGIGRMRFKIELEH